jgi:hypothetical protein
VSPETAYTGAHILKGASGMWWQGPFAEGRLEILHIDPKTDVALVRAIGGVRFPTWHSVSNGEPEVGERLLWRGRGYYAKGWYLDDGLYYGLSEDGNLSFGHGAHPGMSGGCIFNTQGEAVGVLSHTWLEDGHDVFRVTPGTVRAYPLWKVPRGKK